MGLEGIPIFYGSQEASLLARKLNTELVTIGVSYLQKIRNFNFQECDTFRSVLSSKVLEEDPERWKAIIRGSHMASVRG